ncbi:hypothetical protein VTO73DRAFT_7939, partial [Trametes versicolor]
DLSCWVVGDGFLSGLTVGEQNKASGGPKRMIICQQRNVVHTQPRVSRHGATSRVLTIRRLYDEQSERGRGTEGGPSPLRRTHVHTNSASEADGLCADDARA